MSILDSLFGNRADYVYSVITPLMIMSVVDGKESENEMRVISAKLEQLGVSEEQFMSLMKNPPQLTLPPTKEDREKTLIEVGLVMLADGKVDDREMELYIVMGTKFGFSPQESANCLKVAREISNEIFPEVDAHGEILRSISRRINRRGN